QLRGTLRGEQERRDVTVDGMPPRLGPQARNGPEGRDVDRVVDVDVEAAPLGLDAIEERRQFVGLADVGACRERTAPHRLECGDEIERVTFAGDEVDGDIGAGRAKLESDGAADAA